MAETSGCYIWKWSKKKIERKKKKKRSNTRRANLKKNVGKVESAPNKRNYRT